MNGSSTYPSCTGLHTVLLAPPQTTLSIAFLLPLLVGVRLPYHLASCRLPLSTKPPTFAYTPACSWGYAVESIAESATDHIRLSLRSPLTAEQTPAKVYSASFSSSSLYWDASNQTITVNVSTANVTDEPTAWQATVQGPHALQPPGSTRCVSAEILTGFLGPRPTHVRIPGPKDGRRLAMPPMCCCLPCRRPLQRRRCISAAVWLQCHLERQQLLHPGGGERVLSRDK